MGKASRVEIRIEEDMKEKVQVEASSLGRTLSEYVCYLIDKDIKQREEKIDLEAQRYLGEMQKWSDRSGKSVFELLDRIKKFADLSTPRRGPREIALELEKQGMKQADIARVLNQQGCTYTDGQPFTFQRVWHLLNPNGFSEREKRLGQS